MEVRPEIRVHEPREALLDEAPDGLGAFRLLADVAPELLVPGGFFACELGASRYESARTYLEESGVWKDISPVRDYGGVDRVVTALLEEDN